jgi:predicted O-linked N-acetylglucosamine transferase (SPINDLY family)
MNQGATQSIPIGIARFQAGRYAEAGAVFLRILADDPDNVTALDMLGRIAALSGQHQQASGYFSRALNGRPGDPMLQFYLGVTLYDLGRPHEAVSLFRKALSSRPGFAKAHGQLALALQQLGRLDEALAAHEAALALTPHDAEAHNNLGAMLQKLGRLDEAVSCYRKALAIAPGSAVTHYNLAAALQDMKRYGEAADCLLKVLVLMPNHARACNRLGVALQHLGRIGEASEAYRHAAELDPGCAEACHKLGVLLATQKRHDQAVCNLQKAVALKPGYVDACFSLANSLYESGRGREADQALGQCLRIDPAHTGTKVLLFQLFNSLPIVPADVPEAAHGLARFDRLLPEWERASSDPGTRTAATELACDCLPFYLAYRPGNQCMRLSRLGDINAALLAERWHSLLPAVAPVRRARIRLLIVSAHLFEHPVWNVILHGLLTHLDQRRFEPVLLYTSRRHDAATERAKALSTRFYDGCVEVDSCLRIIAGQRPDIIFYPEVGIHGLASRLAHLRLAPLQAAGWGHPITTGSPMIDLYFSGALIEGHDADHQYREKLIRLPGTGACTLPPIAAPEPLSPELRALLDRVQGPRYILCHTEFKHDPSHDDLYPRIAARTGRCRFFVLISMLQGRQLADRLVGRLRAAFARHGLEPDDYLEFVPWQPVGRFYSLLDEMDVYLDCPAFSGYTTAWQAVHRGLPIVTLEGEFMRQRLAAGILRQAGCAETIASTAEEYVRIAAETAWEGLETGKRDQRRARIRAAAAKLNDNVEVVRRFEQALCEELSTRNHGDRPAGAAD